MELCGVMDDLFDSSETGEIGKIVGKQKNCSLSGCVGIMSVVTFEV